jgi:YihY family inner membrane protein
MRNPARVLHRSIRDFFSDGGLMLSASVAFFAMMAIVPFSLFVVSLMGYFLGESRGFYDFFLQKLSDFFPQAAEQMTAEVRKLITFRGVGRLSLLLYALLSYEFFSALESAVNRVFKVAKRRHFFSSALLGLLMVTAIVVLMLLSFALSTLMPLLAGPLRWLRLEGLLYWALKYAAPFLLVLAVVVLSYMVLPARRVGLRYALCGGLFSTLMLEAAKHVFTLYMGTVSIYGAIYGPLAAMVFFLLWLFYACAIFLMGAEVVHVLQEG